MSEILKEMSETLLRNPDKIPSSKAAHVALFFATAAWNESVGGTYSCSGGLPARMDKIETDNPALWNELKSSDVSRMIDELIDHKKSHYPNDRRRILVGGILDGKIHVQWLPPAAPGVDPQWETRLYGLVKTGDRMGAIRFLQTTPKMSRLQAAKRVDRVATELGMA